MSDTFAFIDTSIFCHYRAFDELTWPTLLKAESVILVVAPVTLSELNDHKDGNDARLRKRAASVLAFP